MLSNVKTMHCTNLRAAIQCVPLPQKALVRELSIENKTESNNRIFRYIATSQLNHIKRYSCIIHSLKSGSFSREYATD